MISFQNGVFYGSDNILGYNKVGQNLEVNEGQAEIVRYIYSEYLNGKGTEKIANELTKKGVPTSGFNNMECIIYFKSFEKSILLRNYSL